MRRPHTARVTGTGRPGSGRHNFDRAYNMVHSPFPFPTSKRLVTESAASSRASSSLKGGTVTVTHQGVDCRILGRRPGTGCSSKDNNTHWHGERADSRVELDHFVNRAHHGFDITNLSPEGSSRPDTAPVHSTGPWHQYGESDLDRPHTAGKTFVRGGLLAGVPKPLTPKEAHFLESFGYMNLIMKKLQAWVSLDSTTSRSVFEDIDLDSDGIELHELHAALLKLGLQVPIQAWGDVFEYLDPEMTGKISYDRFVAGVESYVAPETQRFLSRHLPSRTGASSHLPPELIRHPSLPAPSDEEVTGIDGYRRPTRQGRPASDHLAKVLETPPRDMPARRQYCHRMSAYVDMAPNLVFDPLKEELASLAKEHRYGTSKDLTELLKLYEQKCGQKGVLSEVGYGSILRKHGIGSEAMISKLFNMFQKNKVVSFQSLLATLGMFTNDDRRKEVANLYRMCSLSSKGKEITKSALLRFLVATNETKSRAKNGEQADAEDIVARLEYQRMEKLSNEIFRELDEDGGGGLDRREFVEGLLTSEAIWTKFAAVNPIRKFKDRFTYLPTTAKKDTVRTAV